MIAFTGSPTTKGDCSASDLQRVDADACSSTHLLGAQSEIQVPGSSEIQSLLADKVQVGEWDC